MAHREQGSVKFKAEMAIQQIEGRNDDGHSPVEGRSDDGHGHIEGNALLVSKDGEIRKIPVPSSDPNDPLNFRPWEKYAVIFCCCWFSIMGLSMAAGLGAILNVFFELYGPQGYSSEQVVFLITLPTLCIGLGNYIILPLSLVYGRRPVFLISKGLATGTSESLLPLMLTEVTFLHERARIFDLGWRWYYWVFVMTVGVGIVFAYLFAFETQFSRPAVSLDGQIVITDEFGVTRVIPDAEAQEYVANMGKAGLAPPPGPAHATAKKKTYAQRIRPWSTPHPHTLRVVALSWLYMAQSLLSPGILYSVLTSSITLGCAVGMSLTYNAVLTQNHGWRQQDVGLVNVGGIVGALLGTLYCTFLGGPFVLGVHTPEHHLLTLAPPRRHRRRHAAPVRLHRRWGSLRLLVVGALPRVTVFQYSFTAVLIVSTTFASEAAPKHPGPALVVVVGTKNIVSFGVTYGLTPMVERHGYEWAFGVLAAMLAAVFLLGIPVYILNPRWRAYVSSKEVGEGLTATD
ncbi:major facilitator superfamily domain-containing protein [Parachaetomium inaequale]|uniref:Major facilitator superfamily domain-containing protein n=1 Tax=Parachaetomium inaequale TaxID=2588326 RepID=A0AAN6PN45_9PEZI|nr:major facilitator superfamily domain-containing protein [Parachaetomium inaequale]